MLKNLSETSVYKFADSMKEEKISDKIKAFAMDGKNGTIYLKIENMEDVFYKMRHKSFNFAGKFATLELFDRGIIQLIYNENHKLPGAVPFFKKKTPNGGYCVVVNISNQATMHDDGTIAIDVLTLYTLMLSAAFSLVIDKNLASVTSGIPELYGSLFVNVISRMVNLDQIKRAKLLFIVTKFFYINIGVDEVRASEKAMKIANHIDDYLLQQTDLAMPIDSYENLENLVAGIKKAFPELTGFEFGLLFDRWIRSYGELSAFAIEYIPFFYTMVIALITNSNNLINVKAIEKEATRHDKNIIQSYNRLEQAVMSLASKK